MIITTIKLSLESQGIDPDDENTVNYLTKLFYSVKGTQKIFEYMHKYLGINFIGDVSYSINEVVFEIEEVTVTDISVYIKTLKEFLSALLYYYDLNIIIDLMNLKVSEVLSVYFYICTVCTIGISVFFIKSHLLAVS